MGRLVFGPADGIGTGNDAWLPWYESPIPLLVPELALVRSRARRNLQTFSLAASYPCHDWSWVKLGVLVHPPFHREKVQSFGAV